MIKTPAFLLALAATVSASPFAAAQDRGEERGGVIIDAITACRSITDSNARLACFDKAAGDLVVARERKELVVLDRAEVKKTRRSLFGFALPRLKFLESDGKEEPETQIETTIETARALGYGKWTLRTPEGATWQTTEAMRFAPRAGAKLTIKRASLGSYFLRINGESVRGMRIN